MTDDDQRPDDPGTEDIDLGDGTWEDVGADGRWVPSTDTRVRAGVVLAVGLAFLLSLATIASVDDGDGREEVAAATTTTRPSTTTTTAPPDPSSIDGEPASERCRSDDRGAQPLRERRVSTVLVLNATRKSGHAGVTTDRLETLGYAVVVPNNADAQNDTTISYRPGFCAESERLADDLGYDVARIEPLSEEELPVIVGRARMVVILGFDSI